MNSIVSHLHRPSPAIPARNNENDAIAYFFHPSYPTPHDLLFTLPCVDPTNARSATESRRGLYHDVALLACQVIADNNFSGRLFFDRKGMRAVLDEVSIQGLLHPGEYFFIVNSDPTYRYPVVPSFRDWRFPHGQIPDTWPSPKASPSTDTVRRCALTNHGFGLTNAHIVPREEAEWFMRNGMARYGMDTRDVNDSRNMMRLRADIHRCFDARVFSIIPKPEFASDDPQTSPNRNIAYVLHVFGSNMEEFSDMYHNMCVQYLDNTSRQYLFARFAWTILIFVKPFVLAGTTRSVIRNNSQVAGMQWIAEDLSGSQLSSLYGGGGSRSASPKKRSRQGEDDVGSLADSDEWYEEIFEFEEGRGRKRFRREASPTVLDGGDRARTPALSNVSTLTSANKTPPPHSPSSHVESSRKLQTCESTALTDC
ncbi:hypothetical protein BDP55DRAFT_613011 [Colletotrichum godetiae]|uniref:HNH nuclease domain-containing protein n=1 Tax=Colletotrichum godetiae TaxID=1209918 RepID=A0AAJ0AI11_9PEZI|nr:uncharacterized protein BDP55DRAFT_613011 [Colletotrichum godetiae]KAK1674261.1 hypothetical protein BDP55DRAFT_613011 [Colletotrichum godetiae]